MLTDLPTLHRYLRIPSSDTTQDALLTDYIITADRIIRGFCKRNLETQDYTEYRDGTGTPDLWLRERPVRVVAHVYLDSGGFYGDGVPAAGTPANVSSSPFAATDELHIGKDFVLLRDLPDGSSKSGILRRLGGGVTGSTLDWPWEWRKGTLTARLPPAWPPGYGNVQIMYTAGYGYGAPLTPATPFQAYSLGALPYNTTLPAELTFVCNAVVSWLRMSTPVGTPLAAETQGNVIALLNRPTKQGGGGEFYPEIGTARQILSRYRENAF